MEVRALALVPARSESMRGRIMNEQSIETATAEIDADFDRILAAHRRLRESLAGLLTAAKIAEKSIRDEYSRLYGWCDFDDEPEWLFALQAAIALAEDGAGRGCRVMSYETALALFAAMPVEQQDRVTRIFDLTSASFPNIRDPF